MMIMKHINKIFKNLFKVKLDQNEKLIKNMEEYDKKTKAKQQESKILVKGKTRRAKNQKENINVHDSSKH